MACVQVWEELAETVGGLAEGCAGYVEGEHYRHDRPRTGSTATRKSSRAMFVFLDAALKNEFFNAAESFASRQAEMMNSGWVSLESTS